jgi:polysaccharide biosynthesis protein PelF
MDLYQRTDHNSERVRTQAPLLQPSSLFQSFFQAGFECSTHRLRSGRRLDLLAASQHDRVTEVDYQCLHAFGIRTVRDGLRWHLIERSPGQYDWSSFLPMLRAARRTGTEVIWDLCHYGYPNDLDIFTPLFEQRFARYARAVARLVREEMASIPCYCPVNEISFWAWAGGTVNYMNPCAHGRGDELKRQLVHATIAATEAIWDVDPRARIVQADPVIHIVADPAWPEDHAAAEGYRLAQYQAWDMLAGRLHPELGGSMRYLDILGVNYYWNNQWMHNGPRLDIGHPQYRSFRRMLGEVYARYHRPLFVAETGVEADRRPAWLAYIGAEARAAMRAGVPLAGLCWYPIVSHPGWDDERYCPNGLFGSLDAAGQRPVYEPLARELRRQQTLFSDLLGALEGEERAPMLEKAYHADEHSALHRES